MQFQKDALDKYDTEDLARDVRDLLDASLSPEDAWAELKRVRCSRFTERVLDAFRASLFDRAANFKPRLPAPPPLTPEQELERVAGWFASIEPPEKPRVIRGRRR